MENDINNPSPSSEGRNDVGFPEARVEKKKSKVPLFIIIALVVLFLAGGVYFILTKPASVKEEGDEITVVTPTQSAVESPTPIETNVDRKEISISVLNGTSISGLAGKVKTALEKLGYSDIEAGNASKKDYETTEVKFASSIAGTVKEEILSELNSSFSEVKTASGSPSGSDIEIITGFPKGYTVTPTSKAATATLTPTGSVSVTMTPTPTPTQ